MLLEPNAGGEPRPIAGATQERKLSGVGSSAWLAVTGEIIKPVAAGFECIPGEPQNANVEPFK
jgi:hypothetical protein